MTDRELYGDIGVDDEDQLQPGDTLDDTELVDVLDRGYSPPDRPPYGYDDSDERGGEGLSRHLAAEIPDPDPYEVDEWTDENALDEDLGNDEAAPRTGRLVQPDEGAGADVDGQEVARDVGIDGAGASAEEAAMHVCDAPEPGFDRDY